MIISTAELISSAEKLQKLAENEADRRGVCSRAYYSIYEDGRLFHDALPIPGSVKKDSKGGMHQDLYERLQNPGLKLDHPDYLKSTTIGALMETLHGKRIKSDYHRDKRISIIEATNSIAECKRVVARLASPPPETPAPEVISKVARPTLTRIK